MTEPDTPTLPDTIILPDIMGEPVIATLVTGLRPVTLPDTDTLPLTVTPFSVFTATVPDTRAPI